VKGNVRFTAVLSGFLLLAGLFGCSRLEAPTELSPQGFNVRLEAAFTSTPAAAGSDLFPAASYGADRRNNGRIRESQLLVEVVGAPEDFGLTEPDIGFVLTPPFRMTLRNTSDTIVPVNGAQRTRLEEGDCHAEPEPGFPNGVCSVGVRFRSKDGDSVPAITSGWKVILERQNGTVWDAWYRGTF
jgi:hypothetical protein